MPTKLPGLIVTLIARLACTYSAGFPLLVHQEIMLIHLRIDSNPDLAS